MWSKLPFWMKCLLFIALVFGLGAITAILQPKDVPPPEPETTTYYKDADGDGRGHPNIFTQWPANKTAPTGHVDNADDCDDHNASVYYGALEVCDGFDNDCNGLVDAVEIYLYPEDTVSVFIDCQSAQEIREFPEQQCFFVTGWFQGEEERRTMRYCRPQGRDPQ